MANRVLRDWTTSEKIDQLSLKAEAFFTRLIMKADDHGCFHANLKLLKAALFPLKDISIKEIESCLNECHKAGIVQLYQAENRDYLKILDFNQRLRNMVSKFPQPDNNAPLFVSEAPPETKRNEYEEETEVETNAAIVWPSFDDFWERYDKKIGKPKSLELWKKIEQGAREKIMEHLGLYALTEKRYRKDPERYLRNKTWEDEVITTANGTRINDKRTEQITGLAASFATRHGSGD